MISPVFWQSDPQLFARKPLEPLEPFKVHINPSQIALKSCKTFDLIMKLMEAEPLREVLVAFACDDALDGLSKPAGTPVLLPTF